MPTGKLTDNQVGLPGLGGVERFVSQNRVNQPVRPAWLVMLHFLCVCERDSFDS